MRLHTLMLLTPLSFMPPMAAVAEDKGQLEAACREEALQGGITHEDELEDFVALCVKVEQQKRERQSQEQTQDGS